MPHQSLFSGHLNGSKLALSLRSNYNGAPKSQEDHRTSRFNFLRLTPLGTSCVPLTAHETTKTAKRQILDPRPKTCGPEQKLHVELVSIISTLYAKLLIVIGFALPVTASVSHRLPVAVDQTQRYGSFCLRLSTVGFGAGSLVFTGLQIGAEIASGPFRAITPGARLLLVTGQMHFIFLNSKSPELARHGALAEPRLMHLIATNVCECLPALVEETRNEIHQLEHTYEGEDGIVEAPLGDASSFLFPCTIEFGLICSVILFETWRRADDGARPKGETPTKSHHLSIDCGSAHRELVIAATILSLLVLKGTRLKIAIQRVTALEAVMLVLATRFGVHAHCLFGVVGGTPTMEPTWMLFLTTDFLALMQSTSRTLLIKVKTAVALDGGRQFDTVYGKHISVAITSADKQASLQRETGEASVVGEGERVVGEGLLAGPLLLLPPLLPPRCGGGDWASALGQRPLIYLAYRVLSDSTAKNILCSHRKCTRCLEI
ncbi:hypothetical protein KM043_005967 [Ampulex compressa]|nr:hypothetical protein KM043_005967 [Ampulex compressa]